MRSLLIAIMAFTPSVALADMSNWSDKTVCRLVKTQGGNAAYTAEAEARGLNCLSTSSSKTSKSPKYEFPTERWRPVDDFEAYFNLLHEHHTYYLYDGKKMAKGFAGCRYALERDNLFFNLNNKNRNQYEWALDCLRKAPEVLNVELSHTNKQSLAAKYFFDELIPYVVNNDNYLRPKFTNFYDKNTDTLGEYMVWGYNAAMYMMYVTYANFGDYYGVSEELDQKVKAHWDKFRNQISFRASAPHWNKCKFDLSRNVGDQQPDYCNNNAAYTAATHAIMGLYFKDSTYIDEALKMINGINKGAYKDGATLDAKRSSDAVSYLAMMSGGLDTAAYHLQRELGLNIYQQSKNRYGTTISDILNYNAEMRLDRTKNYKYAKLWDRVEGKNHTDLHDEERSSGTDAVIRYELRAGLFHLYDNPKFMKWQEPGKSTVLEINEFGINKLYASMVNKPLN